MASTSEQRALEWSAKGDKYMKKSFLHSADPRAAADCFEKAANLYKLEKQWDKAGAMLEKVGSCLAATESVFAAGRQYQAAALAYKNGTVANAIASFKIAVSLFVEDGKFSQAGKALKEQSQLEEAEGSIGDAFASICTAIDYLETANEPMAASQLREKAAQLACESNQCQTAAALFEAIAKNVSSSMAQIDPYFRATICHLAGGDTVATSKCLERYGADSSDFAKSAEFLFIDEIIQAIETGDRAIFEEAAKTYQQRGRLRLDAWKTQVLKRIKESIPEEGENLLL